MKPLASKELPGRFIWLLMGLYMLVLGYGIWSESDDWVNLCFGLIAIGLTVELLLFQRRLLFYLMILLVPVSVAGGYGEAGFRVDFPSELIMTAIAGLFMIKGLSRPFFDLRLIRHPITVLLAIDLGIMILATVFSTHPVVSIKRIVIRSLFLFVFYFVFAHWFSVRKNISRFYLLYGAGAMFVIYKALQFHSNWGFSQRVATATAQPYFADHTIYGACLAFLLPFLVIWVFRADVFGQNWRMKFFGILSLLAVTAGEIFSYSRAAWLSLIAAAGLYGLIRLKIRIGGLLSLVTVGIGLVLIFQNPILERIRENDAASAQDDIGAHVQSITNIETDESNLERINRWFCAIRMFNEKPLTGFGPGTYQFEYQAFQNVYEKTRISTTHGDRGNAHSEYLTYLSETGILGFLNYLLLTGFILGLGLKLIYRNPSGPERYLAMAALLGLATFMVHGLFNMFIDQDKIAILVFGSLAVLVSLDVYGGKGEKKLESGGGDMK